MCKQNTLHQDSAQHKHRHRRNETKKLIQIVGKYPQFDRMALHGNPLSNGLITTRCIAYVSEGRCAGWGSCGTNNSTISQCAWKFTSIIYMRPVKGWLFNTSRVFNVTIFCMRWNMSAQDNVCTDFIVDGEGSKRKRHGVEGKRGKLSLTVIKPNIEVKIHPSKAEAIASCIGSSERTLFASKFTCHLFIAARQINILPTSLASY